MTRREWVARVAERSQRLRALIAGFRCAPTATAWQVEVESFIRQHLYDWAFDPFATQQDPRLILVRESARGPLIGLAAHERATLATRSGRRIAATKLEVIAVSTEWQGRRFSSGERASDVVMSAAMTDISSRVPRRHARVIAVIHEENLSSLRLCQRHGFVTELSPAPELPQYRRLVTGGLK